MSWCSCAFLDQRTRGIIAGGNIVYVEIEWHQDAVDRDEVKLAQPRFFAGFAEGDFFDMPWPSAWPPSCNSGELAVVRQQRPLPVGRENPGGGRDMSGPAGAIEAVRMRIDEIAIRSTTRVSSGKASR